MRMSWILFTIKEVPKTENYSKDGSLTFLLWLHRQREEEKSRKLGVLVLDERAYDLLIDAGLQFFGVHNLEMVKLAAS